MRSSLLQLFGSPRSKPAPSRPRRRATLAKVPSQPQERFSFRFDLQRLEERHALAIDTFQLPFGPLVLSGSTNYAVLLMNDGDTTFLKKNASAAPTLSFANNSQFLDGGTNKSISVPEATNAFGSLTTLYATSGYRATRLSFANPALSTSMTYTGLDVGTSSGIIGGTFTAFLSVTDADGKQASAAIQAMPSEGIARLKIERTGGDGALPFESKDGGKSSFIDTFNGDVTLRFEKAPLAV